MSIRASQIYIRSDLKHKLLTIAKASVMTADELGDRLIEEGLKRNYPCTVERFEEIKKIEGEIVSNLQLLDNPLLLHRIAPEQQRQKNVPLQEQLAEDGSWGQRNLMGGDWEQ